MNSKQVETLRDIRDGVVVAFKDSRDRIKALNAHTGVLNWLIDAGYAYVDWTDRAEYQHHSAMHVRYKVKITEAGTATLAERARAEGII